MIINKNCDFDQSIQLLVLPVDGVITDGSIWMDPNGQKIKRFNTQDFVGIKQLIKNGIEVAIVSEFQSPAVTHWAVELQIKWLLQGTASLEDALFKLHKQVDIPYSRMAYVGSDLPDQEAMKQVGLSIAVSNSIPAVKSIAHWITFMSGGSGAVREVCDVLLENKTDKHSSSEDNNSKVRADRLIVDA